MAINKDKKIVEKVECLDCREFKTPTGNNFYTNINPLITSEKMPICRECIIKYLGDKDSLGYINRIYHVLALLDRVFLIDRWEKCDAEWASYVTQVSSLKQLSKLTFKDSDFGIRWSTKDRPKSKNVDGETTEDINYLNELSLFWGKSLDDESLEFLQTEYEKLTNAYECDSYAMEILFQEAAHQRLTIKKLRESDKSVEKELKTLQDILGSANIKPVQESGANSVEQATFGTLIKKYENEKPIPEPDEAWKDVDGIKKYITVWFLGHFSKMVGIKNEHSTAYDEEMNAYKVEPPKFEDDYLEESGEES